MTRAVGLEPPGRLGASGCPAVPGRGAFYLKLPLSPCAAAAPAAVEGPGRRPRRARPSRRQQRLSASDPDLNLGDSDSESESEFTASEFESLTRSQVTSHVSGSARCRPGPEAGARVRPRDRSP